MNDTAGQLPPPPDTPRHDTLHTQDLLLTVLGRHLLRRPGLAVASQTFLDLLAGLGVAEPAARSTLARMVQRDLLAREPAGRRAYYTLTLRSLAVLSEGHARIFAGDPVRHDWDGRWTLLSFSIPESRRDDRHRLRTRLAWHGFGPVRDGLWIAPGRRAVDGLLAELDLHGLVEVFHGAPAGRTDPTDLVRRAWDLRALADGYRDFLTRWADDDPTDPGDPGDPTDPGDDLTRQIRLITDWRLLIAPDPILPPTHLPTDWPAVPAATRFRTLHDRLSPGAERRFAALLAASPAMTPDTTRPAG